MNVEITRLSSGLTVVTETMPHLESVALGVWIKSGSRNETQDEHGIAHLLEHMAFKGTKRRSARDIAEEIENVGGELNAATSTETTSYYARVLKDHVPLAVDILADILTESEFDEEELRREKHVILQEIGAANDTPDDVIFDRFSEIAFKGQTIGRPILGTPETVNGFTPGQIRVFPEFDKTLGTENGQASVTPGVQSVRCEPVYPKIACTAIAPHHHVSEVFELRVLRIMNVPYLR